MNATQQQTAPAVIIRRKQMECVVERSGKFVAVRDQAAMYPRSPQRFAILDGYEVFSSNQEYSWHATIGAAWAEARECAKATPYYFARQIRLEA